MKINLSPYICHANTEINWLPMDTEKLYNENLKYKKNLLEKYNWINSNFTYKFNSHGFRCNEFNNDPSIVFLGCSMTIGIGLPISDTWATLVADQLDLSCYNLGIGGSSNDTAFRLSYAWLEKIKPKIVVFCQTFAERLEIWSSTEIISNIAKESPNFYNHWLANENNSQLNQTKNRLAIKQLCDQLDIKFICVDVKEMPDLDRARDLAHLGVNSNIEFSKLVLNRIA
jgi:hypothetical protein